MARRYLVDPLPPPGPAALPVDVGHHIAKVLRARAGDTVRLFDGRGHECVAAITAVGRRVEAIAGAAVRVHREPRVQLELAFALPKSTRAEWLFEHATEVGVAVFRPIVTARARPAGGRVQRWDRIVCAAAGQCDRSLVPEVLVPEPLDVLLARDDLPAERWIATASDTPLDAAASEAAVLLVGPEGGFTQAEITAAAAAGFAAAHLGPLTLRTETAALAGAVRLLAGS